MNYNEHLKVSMEIFNGEEEMMFDGLDCIPITSTADQQQVADTLRTLLRNEDSEPQRFVLIDSIISSKTRAN